MYVFIIIIITTTTTATATTCTQIKKMVTAALYWKLKLELFYLLTGILNSVLSILYVWTCSGKSFVGM